MRFGNLTKNTIPLWSSEESLAFQSRNNILSFFLISQHYIASLDGEKAFNKSCRELDGGKVISKNNTCTSLFVQPRVRYILYSKKSSFPFSTI